jgi:hypothetical protein
MLENAQKRNILILTGSLGEEFVFGLRPGDRQLKDE